ncbi:hypothetical protein TcasGA2_TC008309 [Tribolium castaneum]|uniref:Uncharacterized protein n=1 Tax=Tribolium castaneum TaxID=7070 RepID=D2A115_TRICA|nr:hypothetical protein TcasGA2_TC008309 [Tribolium castaneum]
MIPKCDDDVRMHTHYAHFFHAPTRLFIKTPARILKNVYRNPTFSGGWDIRHTQQAGVRETIATTSGGGHPHESKGKTEAKCIFDVSGSEGGLHHRSVKDPTKKLSVVWWPRTTTMYRSLHFIAFPSPNSLAYSHIYIRNGRKEPSFPNYR